jgi:hypothetical protein
MKLPEMINDVTVPINAVDTTANSADEGFVDMHNIPCEKAVVLLKVFQFHKRVKLKPIELSSLVRRSASILFHLHVIQLLT